MIFNLQFPKFILDLEDHPIPNLLVGAFYLGFPNLFPTSNSCLLFLSFWLDCFLRLSHPGKSTSQELSYNMSTPLFVISPIANPTPHTVLNTVLSKIPSASGHYQTPFLGQTNMDVPNMIVTTVIEGM